MQAALRLDSLSDGEFFKRGGHLLDAPNCKRTWINTDSSCEEA